MKRLNLLNQRFSRLTVTQRLGPVKRGRCIYWLCNCDCGNVTSVRTQHLISGIVKSCGCFESEARWRHGHALLKTATYRSWDHMMQRCYNEQNDDFLNYGGRGIKVCDEWQSFKSFLRDMGDRPKSCSIHRINNDLGYEPGNCKWATAKEQASNRRPRK